MRWTSALLAAATVIGTGLSGAAPLPMRSASAAASEGVAVSCRGLPATIVGTPGRDRLVGTDGPDVIVAGAGPDLVEAHAGDDVICAGKGRDQIRPDAGDDVVNGGPGRDRVLGSAGSDRLDAGPGTDALSYDCGPGLFIRPCHAEVGVDIDLRAGTARQAGAVDRLRTSSSGGRSQRSCTAITVTIG